MAFLIFVLIILTIILIYFVLVSLIFKKEIKATFERDPAATNFLEVLLTYSGLSAIIFYRIAHKLFGIGIPFFPRFISQFAKWLTGIEIHPGATIGEGLFIDHGMGVVIGETSVIGNNVTLFQGVTLGGTGKEPGKRHPPLGNKKVVGAGAKILGNVNIGDNVQIGANAVVIKDVPPNSTVVGIPGRVVRKEGKRIPGISLDHTSLPDPIAQRLDRLQDEIDHIEGEIKDYREKKHKSS
ncbi:MAG: serine O-acetyltransferase [Candidatus Omnitrophota bacterium]|nr:MAG: serine O-acetyltransferase [Candidatus Omnitrophota bacterium]